MLVFSSLSRLRREASCEAAQSCLSRRREPPAEMAAWCLSATQQLQLVRGEASSCLEPAFFVSVGQLMCEAYHHY